MSFAPIALLLPEYDELTYAGWWLKAYEQGTSTPLVMATDATGATTLAKCLLDSEGFPITSLTGPKFIPFIDGDYDLWLFPTEGEADGDITVNAIQLADNINADPSDGVRVFLDNVIALSSNTVITTTHSKALLDCTSTITLDFTASATLGDGFTFVVINSGTGLITLDANGSETINGSLAISLWAGEWAIFTCDGTNWHGKISSNYGGRLIKGADVASIAALILGTDGNYFDITGTTAITSIATRGQSGIVKLHFDGILILTYHATNLILPGAGNITTAVGDEVEFFEYAAGMWRCVSYLNADISASGFESGTKMLFQQTNAPIGWTKETTHNDKSLRVVSGAASSGGADAFSTVFATGLATASHILTIAQMPSHDHDLLFLLDALGASSGTPTTAGNGDAVLRTSLAGGGGGHTHNLTMDLEYVDIIIAARD